jgi:acetyl-CoA acyltransferase 2
MCWKIRHVLGIFIIGAKRTPFCGYGGALREMAAGHAFAAAATDAIRTAMVDPCLIDNTVVGNVHYVSFYNYP